MHDFELNEGTKNSPIASFVLAIHFKIKVLKFTDTIKGRSVTKNTFWEGFNLIFRKLLTCGLKEGTKAV
jgi:hypothetical protein